MNAIAQDVEWDPFGPATAEAPGTPAVVAEEVTTPTTEPLHRPILRLVDAPRDALIPTKKAMKTLLRIKDTAYAPPFWLSDEGMPVAEQTDIPMCPPIAVGGKAMVLDDWRKPRVVEVTGMHEGEIEAMYGTIPIRCKAWVAVDSNTEVDLPPGQRTGRLTQEEADALEAEIKEWSTFLGARAEKHRWCETFESILLDMGIEPIRPGFKSVTLQVYTELKPDMLKEAVSEHLGGEIKAETMTAVAYVELKDVSRADFKANKWNALLKDKGYNTTHITQIYVHAKEPMPL